MISKKITAVFMGNVVLSSRTRKKINKFARRDSHTLPESFLCFRYCQKTEMSFAFTNETRHNLVLHGLAFCNESFTQLCFMK